MTADSLNTGTTTERSARRARGGASANPGGVAVAVISSVGTGTAVSGEQRLGAAPQGQLVPSTASLNYHATPARDTRLHGRIAAELRVAGCFPTILRRCRPRATVGSATRVPEEGRARPPWDRLRSGGVGSGRRIRAAGSLRPEPRRMGGEVGDVLPLGVMARTRPRRGAGASPDAIAHGQRPPGLPPGRAVRCLVRPQRVSGVRIPWPSEGSGCPGPHGRCASRTTAGTRYAHGPRDTSSQTVILWPDRYSSMRNGVQKRQTP